MGHKGDKVVEVNSSGVMMVNGKGWESSRRESRSGHEDLLGKINLPLLGQAGESPSKVDSISKGGQEQDLICEEVQTLSQNEFSL